jgi:hypothetical protein
MKVVFRDPLMLVNFYDPEHGKWLVSIGEVPYWSLSEDDAMPITLVNLSNLVRKYPALEDCIAYTIKGVKDEPDHQESNNDQHS